MHAHFPSGGWQRVPWSRHGTKQNRSRHVHCRGREGKNTQLHMHSCPAVIRGFVSRSRVVNSIHSLLGLEKQQLKHAVFCKSSLFLTSTVATLKRPCSAIWNKQLNKDYCCNYISAAGCKTLPIMSMGANQTWLTWFGCFWTWDLNKGVMIVPGMCSLCISKNIHDCVLLLFTRRKLPWRHNSVKNQLGQMEMMFFMDSWGWSEKESIEI